jgi:hypothetical protein
MRLSVQRMAAFGATTVVVIGLMAVPASGAGAAAAAPVAVPVVTTPWRVVYETRAGLPSLRDISALSSRDIWAVGDRLAGPFVARWTGRRWETAGIPHPAGFNPQFIQAPSPADVWVLGYEPDGSALALHWDGGAWHTVGLPVDASASGVVFSPSDIWLVANFGSCVNPGGECVSAVLHWNGRAWRRFSLHTLVAGVAGTSDRDLWLIGQNKVDVGGPGHSELVGFRWNGKAWRSVTMSHPEIAGTPALTVASPANVWISAEQPTLGVHWNGTRWTMLTAPDALGTGPIAIDGRGGAWFGPDLHWTGRGWIEIAGRWLPSWANPFAFVSMSHIPGTGKDVVAVVSQGGTLIGANGPLG